MHDGAHERTGGEVRGRVGRCRRGRLDGRHRLSGQHGFVALELVRLQQPHVGRDHVADAQGHDITGHEVAHVEELLGAVAPHQGLVADVGVQRGDRDLGAVLVDKAQPDAQDHDRGDDPAIDAVTRGRGHGRGGEQQEEQRVAELPGEDTPHRHPSLGQDVAPERLSSGGGFLRGQA